MENALPVFAFVVFTVWIIIYWRGGTSVLKSIRESTSAPDRVVLVLLTVLLIAIFVHALYVILTSAVVLLPFAVQILGSVLELVGVIGMFYCRSILGRFWTAQTVLRTDHQVVDTSAYGIVRHPIYTGALVMIIGLGLVYSTAIGLVITVLNVVGYFAKTALEDRYLGEHLTGYADYQKRTRFKLIPGVW